MGSRRRALLTGSLTHSPARSQVSVVLDGWGVADDLAGVAAMFGAISILKSAGFSPAGDVYVASTPSKRHRRGITALLARGLDADAALYLHPAELGCGLSDVKAFSSGQVEFLVTVAGAKPDT